jgi:hypothetical protein
MNQKKAKALRKMIRAVPSMKDLQDRAYKNMGIGFDDGKSMITVAGDTKRGQYIALKAMIKEQYK